MRLSQVHAGTAFGTPDAIAVARANILQTLHAYAIAGDRGRSRDLADNFLESGVLQSQAWRRVGRAEISAELERIRASANPHLKRVRHHLTTSLIDLTAADRATARTYFFVLTNIGPDHGGNYDDVLCLTSGRWLFESRKVYIDWVSNETLFNFEGYNLKL
jgi:hypothetical protein